MARTLSMKQKRLLREFAVNVPEKGIVFYDINTMDIDIYNMIESIRPCEIFWINAQQYIIEQVRERSDYYDGI